MTNNSTQNFIATIEADRDQKIAQITLDTDREIAVILGEAHERSRQLQHDTNSRLRRELSNKRKKETSRIQTRLKRQLWQSLAQLQADIKVQVLERLMMAWSNAQWQQSWCEFWLSSAITDDEKHALRVEIDRSALPETLEFIRRWAAQHKLVLEVDDSLREAGLLIYWEDFELDGRINSLNRTIEDEVLAKLAPMVPQLQQIDTL